ncbi:MAG TPA: DUF1460 domain-containing protein [Paludibacter sp.]|nr:DUF1460 domain-containing protein [Paludibacter sp.]
MSKKFYIIFFLLFLSIPATFSQSAWSDADIEKQSVNAFEDIVDKFKTDKSKSTGDLLIKIGRYLLEKPYVGHTLEHNDTEQLVVNLLQFDCTTLAENCLALARTLKNPVCRYDTFRKELQAIRYRNGQIADYTSRLHYFSDWIFNNVQKNIVRDISCEMGNVPFTVYVDYMSQHPESYKMLKNNAGFINKITATEKEISARKNCFIPKNEIQKYESLIHDGDILGITTNMKGMDISHVVMAVYENKQLRILHASSKLMKVVISNETLIQYLANRSDATGIVIARPL